jgi:hypothetical protein
MDELNSVASQLKTLKDDVKSGKPGATGALEKFKTDRSQFVKLVSEVSVLPVLSKRQL